MADLLSQLKDVLHDPQQFSILMVVNALLNSTFYLGLNKIFGKWCLRQPWWETAVPFQKQLMAKFGYAEEDLTPDAVLETYAFTIVGSIHHAILGGLTFPVLFLGWEGGGPVGQLCFYIGILGEMGFDLYNSIRVTILRFCPACFPQRPVPMGFFLFSIFQHSLGLGVSSLLLRHYDDAWEFHWLASSLLFATACAQGTGAYKFTLNTSTFCDFYKYKTVVMLELLITWSTRFFLWFYASYFLIMQRIYRDMSQFRLAVFLGALFTVVNVAMVADATAAAIKWLPRSAPKTRELCG